MRDIAEHIVEALGAGHDVVLVTVVGSRGSTPRNALLAVALLKAMPVPKRAPWLARTFVAWKILHLGLKLKTA